MRPFILFLVIGCGTAIAVETGLSGQRGMGVQASFRHILYPMNFGICASDFNMEAHFGGKKKYQARLLPHSEIKPCDRKNEWRTALPHWGNNAPLAVGDKVFVMTEPGWKHDAPQLVCLSIASGEILWQGDVDHLNALSGSTQKEAKEARAKELKRFREYMHWWNRIYHKGNCGVVQMRPPMKNYSEALEAG